MIKSEQQESLPFNDALVEALVCPLDRADLIFTGTDLVCVACGRRYPVDDGVPEMLVEQE